MMRRGLAAITLVLFGALAPDCCESASGLIENVGDIGEIVLPAGALAGALILDDREGVGQLLKAYALETGAVALLKRGIDRRRPDGGRHSFPSGHTAGAFLGATFLHKRYGWKYGTPAYAAAVFVGYSRIHAERHWTTDVLAGAAIGVGANLAFTRRRKKTILIHPSADADAISCRISIHW